jgi:hypothetical protein
MHSTPTTTRYSLTAGALAGLCGALLFASAHAIVIVPIWSRSASGLAFGALAGVAAGWAYAQLGFDARVAAARSLGSHLAIGARFGALLWAAVVPVTLADALLRALHVAPRYELIAVAVAVLLAVSAGAFLGWRMAHARRAMIAGAAATLLLTMAMGGPVPIGRGVRAVTIFLAVLPAATIGGAVLAALSSRLRRLGLTTQQQHDATTPA